MRSRLRLSRIFLATPALCHTGLQSKAERRSSVSPTYSQQEVRRRKLHYLKAECAKSWSAWRWGADRNQDTRMQTESDRRRKWENYSDKDGKWHMKKEVKKFWASKNKKRRIDDEMLATVRKTEGCTQTRWEIGAGSQFIEKPLVENLKRPRETEQIQS